MQENFSQYPTERLYFMGNVIVYSVFLQSNVVRIVYDNITQERVKINIRIHNDQNFFSILIFLYQYCLIISVL